MKSSLAILLLALLGCFYTATYAQSGCNCVIPTDLCCNDLNNNNGNPTCYNPTLYQCNGGNRLCPKGLSSCGKACYNPNQYSCSNGALVPVQSNPCSINNGGCGSLSCCSSGGACYNSANFQCTPQGLVPKCAGIPATSSAVCSGKGTCTAPNTCNCNPGYTGNNCQSFDCNISNGGCTFPGGSTLACCPTGTLDDHCYNPNHRACLPGGLVVLCLGVPATNATVCSGNGDCIGINQCRCRGGFTGTNCEFPPSGCNCFIPTDQCCRDLNNNGGNPTCYNPSLFQCNNVPEGQRLCPKGFSSCGSACYDPSVYFCNSNGQLQHV